MYVNVIRSDVISNVIEYFAIWGTALECSVVQLIVT